MPRWSWRERTLFVVRSDGAEATPLADDIYRVLVELKSTEGMPPVDAPPKLKISRYPLVPALVLSLGEGRTPTLGLIGRSRGVAEVLTASDLTRGHVVISGCWFPIEADTCKEAVAVLSELDSALGPCSLRALLRARSFARKGLVEDLIGDSKISPLELTPSSTDVPCISGALYPYQLSGWRWLRFIRSEGLGGLLADEMGLGKTLQVISALLDPKPSGAGPCLIVCPGSLLENWRREIGRFAPTLRTLKHHGPRRTGRPADLLEYDVIVTSYDSVVRDNSLLGMIEWDAVVLDEAQFIRNPSALRTKAVKHLRRRVGIAVTGTPVENRLLDLWSIIDFALPGQLGEQRDFEANFPDDVDSAMALESVVSPFVLRRRIQDVAQDLPAKIDIPQVVELSDQEADGYENTRQRIVAENENSAATLVTLTALRQFCAHPMLVLDDSASKPMQFSKFQRLDEILREIFLQREKALVFTSFTAMADLIADHVRNSLGAFSGVIDGRLPVDERQPLIDDFSSTCGPAALILNPRAGGSGLNITAANHVIHYNPEWNPALEDQASARAHRRGQELPVTVHRLLVADTVEDVICERLERKRTVAKAAVVGITGREDDYADIISALARSPIR